MTQGGKGLLVRALMSVVLMLVVALLSESPASALRPAVVVAGGGVCSVGSVSAEVFVDRDAAVAPYLPAPDGNRVEGTAMYVGLVRNDTSQQIAVTRVDVCFFEKGGALLCQMTMRDSFVSTIAVDAVIPAGSYSPFSELLLFDGGGYLNSVADVETTRTAFSYEIADRAPRFGKVTVSTVMIGPWYLPRWG